MSERRSPLKISPEKRKREGLDEDAGSSPRKKSSLSSTGSQPSGRFSPEPNCPICLGPIESKAFAHGCFHSFCRTCLFEWSKIKPECPVCRQSFTRIIFNVKSMSDYEEHAIQARGPNPLLDRSQSFHFWALHNLGPSSGSASASLQRLMTMDEVYRVPAITPFIPSIPHFVTSSASSSATGSSRSSSLSYRITISPRQQTWPEGHLHTHTSEQPFGHLRLTATHRGTHLSVAPTNNPSAVSSANNPSVVSLANNPSVISIANNPSDYQPFPPIPGTSAFRRYIYDYNLWAKNDSTRSIRVSSAKFYRENPALTHRLIPFFNRELNAILDSCQEILPQLISSLTQCDIRSRRFRRILEPHLVRRTDQFIHEIYSFAISNCHDMLDYDNRVVYVRKEQTKIFTTDPPVPPLGFSYEVESSDESVDETPPSVESVNSSVIEILDSDDEVQVDERREVEVGKRRKVEVEKRRKVEVEKRREEVVTEATLPVTGNELHMNIIDDFDNPRPGPSGLNLRNVHVTERPARHFSDSESDLDVGCETEQPTDMKDPVMDDTDSDESVQIIGSRKALRERTPVLIDLSDTDSDDADSDDADSNDAESEDTSRFRHRRKHKKGKHQSCLQDCESFPVKEDASTRRTPEKRLDQDTSVEDVNQGSSNAKTGVKNDSLSTRNGSPLLKSVIGDVIINGKSSKSRSNPIREESGDTIVRKSGFSRFNSVREEIRDPVVRKSGFLKSVISSLHDAIGGKSEESSTTS